MGEYRNPNPRAFIGKYFILDMGVIIGVEYDDDDETMAVFYENAENLEFAMDPSEYQRFQNEYVQYLSGY